MSLRLLISHSVLRTGIKLSMRALWRRLAVLVARRSPFPHRPHWPLWSVPFYLLAADLVNTAFPPFSRSQNTFFIPPIRACPGFCDNGFVRPGTAGVIMWVPGSLAFVIPAVAIAVQISSRRSLSVRPAATLAKARVSAAPRFERHGDSGERKESV